MTIPDLKIMEQPSLTATQTVKVSSRCDPNHSMIEILEAVNGYYDACRYLGITITVKSLLEALKIYDALCGSYGSFEHWKIPGESTAPPYDCYVYDFFRQVFVTERHGLIINEPENWFYKWTTVNQKAFWCELSQHYGRSPIIVIAKEVESTTTFLQHFFRVYPVALESARFWVSNHHIR